MRTNQRIAFVQFGDYLETVERFSRGGEETYFAQRYSVGLVERLPQAYADVIVVSVGTGSYDQVLPSGVRAIGLPALPHLREGARQIIGRLEPCSPTTVIVRTPSILVIKWCLKTGKRVLPLLADSFRRASPRRWLFERQLARLLNQSGIDLVANHQLSASRDLTRIGIDPGKVIPWDWPSDRTPSDFPAKKSVRDPGWISVMFAGKICEDKGVGDLLHAVAWLHQVGMPARATFAGDGEIDRFRALAGELGIGDFVVFAGLVPHRNIAPMMHGHDVVVVPSRHRYGEGLPMTIFDSMISRSPLVVSDHPMFVSRLEDGRSALVFREKDSLALAEKLRRLGDDSLLYESLSVSSEETWGRLRIPLMWGNLVERWLSGTDEDLQWIKTYSLNNFIYDS